MLSFGPPDLDMASFVPFHSGDEIQPLESRIVRSQSKIAMKIQLPPQRCPTYREYSTTSVERAYKAVTMGEMSLRKAAEEYGVPRSTLHDKVKGKSAINVKSGTKKYLSDGEEAKLVEFLAGCATVGYAKSRKEVQAIVQQIVSLRDPHIEITKGWWDSFKHRHPEITLRQAEPLSYARAVATNPQVVEKYFSLLEETMEANGLTRCPGQIFNCDETGMPLAHKPAKVVSLVGQKHPYAITSGEKAQITVLACASASGYTIPPMVIFDRKQLQVEMTRNEVPGTFYGLSDSGWMDMQLFEEWFKGHFLVHAPSARPLLLLLDGHSSHYNPRLLRIAAEEGVILLCLPPHTTHLLQPLDNGTFSSLKDHWRRECQKFYAENPGKVLNRRNFMGVFHKAWVRGMTISNVIACFRLVYPLDKQVVVSQLPCENGMSPTREVPMPYVPFCTPRRGETPGPRAADDESLKHTMATYSSDEIESFQARLQASKNSRYAVWLETFHPRAHESTREDTLGVILKRPMPPAQYKKLQSHPTCGRVLTSQQCIQELAEKEEKKRRQEEEKEERKKQREKKKREKEEEKKQKRKKQEIKKTLCEKKLMNQASLQIGIYMTH